MKLIIYILFISIEFVFLLEQVQSFTFKVSHVNDLLKNGTKCVDIIDYFLNRAYTYNTKINALISFNQNAKLEAIELDKYYEKNKKFIGSIHCVPLIIKDNVDVKGIPTTGGIRALRNLVPNKDSQIIARLRAQGGIVIAKANLAELAQGNVDSELGKLCKNPYDLERSCGRSSSGTGSAIAAGLGVIGIGTDTTGSIIYPSDLNGLFGLRPTLYKPPMDGIIPLLDRQDTVGPMTKYLDDMVLAYSIINNDTSLWNDYSKAVDPKTLKLGVITNFTNSFSIRLPKDNFSYTINSEKKQLLDETINLLKKSNVNVFESSLNQSEFDLFPTLYATLFDYRCLKSCIKYSYTNYLTDKDRFGPDSPYQTFDQLLKSPLLSKSWEAEFNVSNVPDAKKFCEDNCVNFDKDNQKILDYVLDLFKLNDVDALIFVTTNFLPPKHNSTAEDLVVFLYCLSSSTGLPSFNVPISFSKQTAESPDGLPIGVYILSRPETFLNSLRIAKIIEQLKPAVKLPHTTPLIKDINKCSLGVSVQISFYIYSICSILHFYLNNF